MTFKFEPADFENDLAEQAAKYANEKLQEWFTADEGNREFIGIQILGDTVRRLTDENLALKKLLKKEGPEELPAPDPQEPKE